jgi:O-methyltransferase
MKTLNHSHLNHELLYSKYCSLINEIEGSFRNNQFQSIPIGDEIRTALIANLLGTSVSESMYLLNYLHKSMVLEGDICEFGIAQGLTSALLAYEIRNTDKNLWLFDSFEGLPKPSAQDQLKDDIFNLETIEAYEGTMLCPLSMIQERLKEIQFPKERTKIVSGFIEQTITNNKLPQKICFAYVDFDFYEPILTALKYIDKKLQSGGTIIVDDYDFFSTGSKTAVDEFLTVYQNYKIYFPIKSAGKFCILEKI